MVESSVELQQHLCKALEIAQPDVLRSLLTTMIQTLMNAEADTLCGADYGQRSEERTNQRNGYRQRPLDTRMGTLDLAIPKLRQGSYYPQWLLEPRRRSERALVSVVAQCYVSGVSTRKVENIAQSLGIERLSKSQVSEMAKSLDEQVEAFRNRPLDQEAYPYVWLDAMVVRCREAGRIVNVAVVIATAVTREGHREVLGLDVITSEDGAGWTAFLRGLVARGLKGVKLVISDAHQGLKSAVGAVLPGAAWQRCRTHFMRNLLCKVPRKAQPAVATLVRSIFAQSDKEQVLAQHAQVVERLLPQFAEAANLLIDAGPDLLAFTDFPQKHWRQIWSNNPQERLNREIRRRTDVVGIFPNRMAIIRLVGSVLAEQNDEWAVSRRYMSLESIAEAIQGLQRTKSEELDDSPALPSAA
ncbi:IS256 family transposase [Desulfovermiculus halophilus]|jgi:transposase-like protein|uniref:IS256 family transposase n=1 Tax=Desulfovermiculus halophilus TaxID=339722 RepID=UPI000687DF12|nr:IS256 family transposase [Desulfovermiculus halophilus]